MMVWLDRYVIFLCEFVRVARNVNDTRTQVQKCFDLASYTANLIRESSNFELAYEPSCERKVFGMFCF